MKNVWKRCPRPASVPYVHQYPHKWTCTHNTWAYIYMSHFETECLCIMMCPYQCWNLSVLGANNLSVQSYRSIDEGKLCPSCCTLNRFLPRSFTGTQNWFRWWNIGFWADAIMKWDSGGTLQCSECVLLVGSVWVIGDQGVESVMQNSKIAPKFLILLYTSCVMPFCLGELSVIQPSSAPAISSLNLHGSLAMVDHMLPSLDLIL